MKTKISILLIFLFSYTNMFAIEHIKKSIVKIHVGTYHTNNEKEPWRNNTMSYFAGSGFVVDGNKILTSANLVSKATWISINIENSKVIYKAKVYAISYDVNLALLELENEVFFEDLYPLKLSNKISENNKISVIGFEAGDNEISIKHTNVERIRPLRKNKYPLIQIDEDLNNIISGSIIINMQQEVVGIGIDSNKYFSDTSYVVPSIIINRFIQGDKIFKKEYFFGRDELRTIILGEK